MLFFCLKPLDPAEVLTIFKPDRYYRYVATHRSLNTDYLEVNEELADPAGEILAVMLGGSSFEESLGTWRLSLWREQLWWTGAARIRSHQPYIPIMSSINKPLFGNRLVAEAADEAVVYSLDGKWYEGTPEFWTLVNKIHPGQYAFSHY